MKTKLARAMVVLAVASAGISAQKADFTGSWVLDPSRSQLPQRDGGMAGRAGGAVRDMTVAIKQTADVLHIEQKMENATRTLAYKLDGSESTNPGMRSADVKSVSRWEGDTIVTEGAQTMSGPNGEITIKSREVRSLASDGTMVVETTRETPRGKMKSKLVFRRAT
jgi:hypothetical protein